MGDSAHKNGIFCPFWDKLHKIGLFGHFGEVAIALWARHHIYEEKNCPLGQAPCKCQIFAFSRHHIFDLFWTISGRHHVYDLFLTIWGMHHITGIYQHFLSGHNIYCIFLHFLLSHKDQPQNL